MNDSWKYLRLSLAVSAAALLSAVLGACSGDVGPATAVVTGIESAPDRWSPGMGIEPFKVYNQNAYLGGNTDPLFGLDLTDISAVLAATNTFWSQVQQSYVPERMAVLVQQIDERRPHLVALEEVFQMAVLDATTGDVLDGADLIASIMAEIEARDLPYELAREKSLTSVTLPLEVDPTTFQVTKALMVTDRIAVLRRTDVDVTSIADGTYSARIPLAPGIDVIRGWIRVSALYRGVPMHLFATHLEQQAAATIQGAQEQELAALASSVEGVSMIAGDLNSDAAGGPGDAAWTSTHQDLLDAGFTDAWDQAGGPAHDQGLTCCHPDDLRGDSRVFDQRIDFVLLRDSRDRSRTDRVSGAIQAEVLAAGLDGITAEHDLWFSDHAGLLVGLRLPPR